ncbi:MAG: 4Fe-4S dicluster domain-containing protein, partial [Thermoplasmata archaeon]|nr:4Fe-4S dicluster domain-containing protein [Thermoplasmata archaeon]
MITEQFKDIIRACEQCGSCTASCPSKYVSDFNIRKLVRHLQLDLHEEEEFLKKDPWLCTLCHRCQELCTEGLDIPKLVFALRELSLENKMAPEGVHKVSEAIKSSNSPYLSTTRTKSSWAESIQTSPDADTLYWAGCTPSIMAPNIPKAAADVMIKLDFKFKLMDNEPCCGEPLIGL